MPKVCRNDCTLVLWESAVGMADLVRDNFDWMLSNHFLPSLNFWHPKAKVRWGDRFNIRIVAANLVGSHHPDRCPQLQKNHCDYIIRQARQQGFPTGQGIDGGFAWGFSGNRPRVSSPVRQSERVKPRGCKFDSREFSKSTNSLNLWVCSWSGCSRSHFSIRGLSRNSATRRFRAVSNA
jgi:hypothetical protein